MVKVDTNRADFCQTSERVNTYQKLFFKQEQFWRSTEYLDLPKVKVKCKVSVECCVVGREVSS